MNIYPVNISSRNDMNKICSKIKTDPRALAYLVPKSNILHFYADNIDYRAAAFLKQELLARGGDTVVTKHVIDGKTDFSNVLLMATSSQIKSLLEKLKAMDCWGLKEFREKLCVAFNNMNIREWVMLLRDGRKIILDDDTKLMAVINLTPDSFFQDSRTDESNILSRAEKLLSEGAYILDIGAESTRPGSKPVSESEEQQRLIPALKILRKKFPEAVISIDTYKPNIARMAADEGADIINDISGFEFDERMPEIIAALNIPYILSHIKGTPENMTMNENKYEDITGEVIEYFAEKLEILRSAGVKPENVIIDPGLGFGKSADDNFSLIKNIESLKIFGHPVLIGHSRKRFTGSENISGTVAISALLYGKVSLLRVHEIGENLRALNIARAVINS